LVLRHILQRRGLASEIVIGVQKQDDGSIKAHAWVERNGKVLIGGGSSPFRYTVLGSPESVDL